MSFSDMISEIFIIDYKSMMNLSRKREDIVNLTSRDDERKRRSRRAFISLRRLRNERSKTRDNSQDIILPANSCDYVSKLGFLSHARADN